MEKGWLVALANMCISSSFSMDGLVSGILFTAPREILFKVSVKESCRKSLLFPVCRLVDVFFHYL